MTLVTLALIAGIGFFEAIVSLIIFAIPGFFLAKWILSKNFHPRSRTSVIAASVVIGLILSPFLAYATFVIVAILTDFHG